VAVNQLVVKSLIASYQKEELEAARLQATADFLSGIQITQVNFEGGGATGRPISGDPAHVLEHVQAALDQIEDENLASQPSSSYFDLSKRQFGT
jgi:hypothetical protein